MLTSERFVDTGSLNMQELQRAKEALNDAETRLVELERENKRLKNEVEKTSHY